MPPPPSGMPPARRSSSERQPVEKEVGEDRRDERGRKMGGGSPWDSSAAQERCGRRCEGKDRMTGRESSSRIEDAPRVCTIL